MVKLSGMRDTNVIHKHFSIDSMGTDLENLQVKVDCGGMAGWLGIAISLHCGEYCSLFGLTP